MDSKTAREAFTKLEALKIEDLGDVLYKLDNLICDAEILQKEVDDLTEEERAGCSEDEEFICERDLETTMEEIEEAFQEVIEVIDNQRKSLDRAEHLVNEAFGVDDGYEDDEPVAA